MTGLAALLRWTSLAAGRWGTAIGRTTPLAAAAAVAALLAAVQWLPTLAMLGRTTRMLFPPESKLFWSTHPATLVDVVRAPADLRDVDGRGPRARSSTGAASPSCRACTWASRRSRSRCSRCALDGPSGTGPGCRFALFVALALGRHFPPGKAILALPPLSMLRYPSKYLWVAALAWALLAGLGTEVWWRSWCRRDRASVGPPARGCWGSRWSSPSRLIASRRGPERLIGAFDVAEPWRAWMAVLASRKLQAAALAGSASPPCCCCCARGGPSGRVSRRCRASCLVAPRTWPRRRGPVNPLAPAPLMTHRPPLLDGPALRALHTRLLSAGADVARLNRDLTRGPAGWEPEWRWTLGLQEMIASALGHAVEPARQLRRGLHRPVGSLAGLHEPARRRHPMPRRWPCACCRWATWAG